MPGTALHLRVQALEAAFAHIGHTRMQGLPLLNPALRVQAVGFAPLDGADEGLALGVLVTPWFMNLLRLPLAQAPAGVLRPGEQGSRPAGTQALWFTGAEEAVIGRFEMCSLCSPMQGLADQQAAVALATEALAMLRATPPTAGPLPAAVPPDHAPVAPAPAPAPSQALPARRGFLFGRSAAGLR
ncbi:MAG: [NiFe]-hydrogenase assembly chaperone HybE [Burkholderiales bacterium]|nr:[NiFe]-hydrogenase assembly chaperone HybE [Burkholderiales bacterium]